MARFPACSYPYRVTFGDHYDLGASEHLHHGLSFYDTVFRGNLEVELHKT